MPTNGNIRTNTMKLFLIIFLFFMMEAVGEEAPAKLHSQDSAKVGPFPRVS